MPSPPLYGAVEAGGTKFVCAVGTGPEDLHAVTRFPTTTPEETLARTVAYFRGLPRLPDAIGIGSFGPVDLNPASDTWGFITRTPKPGWSHTDFAGALGRALGVPVAFDTDVNAAAVGEHRWGAARGLGTVLYLTVGTGIGGGVLVDGRPVHGLLHPEMGHLLVPRAPDDPFPGRCPFHGACLEGMACGPALRDRWGVDAAALPPDHPAWDLEAHYLAHGLVSAIVLLSPERIILGGGVMQQPALLPRVRRRLRALLNGYITPPGDDFDAYLVAPGLGDRAGILGALALGAKVA